MFVFFLLSEQHSGLKTRYLWMAGVKVRQVGFRVHLLEMNVCVCVCVCVIS